MHSTLPCSIEVKSLAAFRFDKLNSYSFHRVWIFCGQLDSTIEAICSSVTSHFTTALSISRRSYWFCILRTGFIIIWVMFLLKTLINCSCLSWIIASSDLKYEPSRLKTTSRVFICINCSLSTWRRRERQVPPPPVGFPASSMPSSSSKTSIWTSASDPVTISGTFSSEFYTSGSLHMSPKSW